MIHELPGTLAYGDRFGSAIASLGDLDGDGKIEVAVGAFGDDSGATTYDFTGAVYVLSLDEKGRVDRFLKIAPGEGGFTGALSAQAGFGTSLKAIGDLDGDGVVDLAVGAYEGSVWILFLNSDGSVKSQRLMASGDTSFGQSLAFLGDIDGDGRPELALGFPQDDGERGTVSIFSLNSDGSIHAQVEFGQGQGGFGGALEPDDYFGSSLCELGDVDGNGVGDLVVGAYLSNGLTGGVWVVFLAADGSVLGQQEIASETGGFTGTVLERQYFGSSVTRLDDADGDGVPELAVGQPYGYPVRVTGTTWILFLDQTGMVKSQRKIPSRPLEKVRRTRDIGFDGPLALGDDFGSSLALVDDLDGDGLRELAVGALGDFPSCGVGGLWILFMNRFADVKSDQKIAPEEGLPIPVEPRSLASVAAVGDLDGDGATELAFGVKVDCADDRGALWIARLADDATISSATRIGAGDGGFTGFLASGDRFGEAVAPVGDLDGDGVPDLAVGAPGVDLGGGNRGAVWILFMQSDRTVREAREIGQSMGGFPGLLKNFDTFGASLAPLDDFDGDGVIDLVVGAPFDDDGGSNRGAVWLLFLQPDGSVKGAKKISETQGGFPLGLQNNDLFGSAVTELGDLDGDHVLDLAVGAPLRNTENPDAGAVWTLLLNADGSVKSATSFDPTQVGFHPRQSNFFGSALASLGDLNGDGLVDLYVGSPGDDGGPFFGSDEGVIWRVALAPDGSASSQTRLLQAHVGIGYVQSRDGFGAFLAALPDMNGDGIRDLGVGHEDTFRLWILHQNGLATKSSGHSRVH